MLVGDDDGVDTAGLVVHIFHSHLGLAVGTQIGESAVLAHLSQTLGELVGQGDCHGHQFGGFIAGETEHHALVAGAGDKFIGFRTGLGLQGVIHTQGNISGLLVDVGDNAAGISIEAVLGTGVADIPDHLTGNFGNIHIAGGGDLTHNVNHTGGAGGLTGYAGIRILR